MSNELPIHLYKANAELQLQITRLLQESSHHWLEVMQQLSAGGVLECWRRFKSDQACRLNFDQGPAPGFLMPGCG